MQFHFASSTVGENLACGNDFISQVILLATLKTGNFNDRIYCLFFICRVQSADTLNAVRIILPDVGVFAAVLAVYVCCHVLLRRANVESSDTSGAAVPLTHDSQSPLVLDRDRKLIFKYGIMVADFAGNFAIVMTCGAVGITLPSLINSVYFVLFIILVTLWSCSVKLGRWFTMLRVAILVFVAVHIVAVHLSQFEFAQQLWQARGNDTVVER
jgi:hypothetical protein